MCRQRRANLPPPAHPPYDTLIDCTIPRGTKEGGQKKAIKSAHERRSVRFYILCTLEGAEPTDFNRIRPAPPACRHHLTFIHLTLPTSLSKWLPNLYISFGFSIQNKKKKKECNGMSLTLSITLWIMWHSSINHHFNQQPARHYTDMSI
jgi:hypothetical protein